MLELCPVSPLRISLSVNSSPSGFSITSLIALHVLPSFSQNEKKHEFGVSQFRFLFERTKVVSVPFLLVMMISISITVPETQTSTLERLP